jgi:hypothetical protein
VKTKTYRAGYWPFRLDNNYHGDGGMTGHPIRFPISTQITCALNPLTLFPVWPQPGQDAQGETEPWQGGPPIMPSRMPSPRLCMGTRRGGDRAPSPGRPQVDPVSAPSTRKRGAGCPPSPVPPLRELRYQPVKGALYPAQQPALPRQCSSCCYSRESTHSIHLRRQWRNTLPGARHSQHQ